MSKYRGMLLFDIADPPIGKWHENLGYRGYLDKWEIKDENGKVSQSITIDLNEDVVDEIYWDVFWDNEDGGDLNTLGGGDYDTAIEIARRFMRLHPNGATFEDTMKFTM